MTPPPVQIFCTDCTLPTPEENLALDEALVDAAETGESGEVLRFWEPKTYSVVVGYANRVCTEVSEASCEREGIPILRRCTGGGTVLQGPGVLNYTLILRIEHEGPTHSITSTNHFVMHRQRDALATLLRRDVLVCGHTDLALATNPNQAGPDRRAGRRLPNLKFSGNAQRRKRDYLIFHGSFLLHLDLDLVEKTLQMPSKQPDYRQKRSHAEFLTNLHCSSTSVKTALQAAWNAHLPLTGFPENRVTDLVRDKYSRPDWNRRF